MTLPEPHYKQKALQTSLTFGVKPLLCCLVWTFGTAAAVAPSLAQTVQLGSGEQMATLRLVAEAGLKAGRYDAGVDLAMAPGSHTYWKMPGEAGVPPVFSFNGSDNVKQAEVKFPAPKRITEEGLDAFGYTDRVVFPVVVTPADASKPSTLHVDVTYAVCNHICVPGHSQANLELRPAGAGTSPDLVAAALAAVPRAVTAAPDLRIAKDAGAAEPSWTLTWTGSQPLTDIFADAPDGFYFSTKKLGAGTWKLTASQSATTPTAKTVPVMLVLAAADGATETTRTFDVGAPAK